MNFQTWTSPSFMNGDMSHQHTIIHIDYFRQCRSTAFHLYRPRPISNAEGEAFSKGFCASLRMFSAGLIIYSPVSRLTRSQTPVSQATISDSPPLDSALQAKLASNLQLCRQGALAANSSPSHSCGNRSRPSSHPLLPSARTIWLPWPARHSQSHNATSNTSYSCPEVHVHHQKNPSYSLRLHSSPSGLQTSWIRNSTSQH